MSWFAIVNPVAGSGKGARDWPLISELLTRHGIEYSYCLTERKYHAVELAVKATRDGYRKLLVVGGDGTVNEVVNGLFIQSSISVHEVLLGTIAVGTGNDWMKGYGIPVDYEQNIRNLREHKFFLQDVGVVNFFESRVKQTRYFVNSAGLGFDADVVKAANNLKENGNRGRFVYLLSVLRVLASFRSSVAKVLADDFTHSGVIFSITLGIGKYSGGGMLQTPDAIPNDGLFDTTLIGEVSRVNVLWNVLKLYNGRILSHPKVLGFRASKVRVSSNPPFNLELDGESMGTSPFEFSIIPKALRVVVGADFSSAAVNPASIYS